MQPQLPTVLWVIPTNEVVITTKLYRSLELQVGYMDLGFRDGPGLCFGARGVAGLGDWGFRVRFWAEAV